MPIDEKKLRAILTQHQENIKRQLGLLVEKTNRKFDLLGEDLQTLTRSLDKLQEDLVCMRDQVDEIRMHLPQSPDLDFEDSVTATRRPTRRRRS